MLEGGGFGRFVGVLGGEEEEEPFGYCAVRVVEKGGGGDAEVGEGGGVEG